ncbi:hypothetical protein PUNSTDRAFT_117607 [Punctularia strigosozonata HHB-11173 SS5]|uniref:uncharacterized protein n=1 Tax=Punctularia strigosozonata (strain HHB-11173) TaxID=741275 RepID=UPI000441780C|nr:uncharacterized protein PUNSTDRAFT_117607 [Punctularia strigosozonata HHB-11173 SS5]EIN13992.1 hypothetical protein PUNSTDRAFT_117607 [Punctularia strigosozonata HHB-11173 SS5]
MGGGDLNMKKSWHPLLLKNQERVWLEEKKALEEKKKLDQLRKEKEEERQLQELQRLQEEKTGRKRTEKLEWMYATPATGSSTNANDLEDYLLGKKRVDKILIGSDNEKIGAAHKSFIATQYANTVRDTASKIREDPLLAIKQQEQAAYEQLMSNPLRLREMQERNGIKVKKEKKEKKEKKHKKDKRRDRSERDRQRSVSRSRSRDRYDDRESHSRFRQTHSPYERRRSPSPYSRSPVRRRDSPRRRSRSQERDRIHTYPKSSDSSDDNRGRHRSPTFERSRRTSDAANERKRRRTPDIRGYDRDSPYTKRPRASPPPPQNGTAAPSADDRAAKLAAMSVNADSMNAERKQRLTELLEKEKAELEAEERARTKSKGMAGFLSHEQKKVFSGEGGLEERIRRGRSGLVREGE